MSRASVDYGIDLGTTNSAIFRMTPRGAEVITVGRLNYIPSAVATTKRGDLKVGTDALKGEFEPVGRWFKRLMGTRNETVLLDGSSWAPEKLSSEILKALKGAVKSKKNEDLTDVVITVPAMFTQPQCAATKEAANLAGLNALTLLQEPIAAATAFLSDAPKEGNYLVYDLGGGTFDLALVSVRDGEMNVVEHGGNNNLGGADFDRRVFDWTLKQIERKGGDIAGFASGRNRFELMKLCEEARILLSDQELASIYLDQFDLPMEKLELTRDRLEDLTEEFITRTIEIANDRLSSRNLKPADIECVLLVGGPTQMPIVRSRIEKELGLRPNFDEDPMLVVAKGAAIHASSMLIERKASHISAAGHAQLRLVYDPVSPSEVTTVAGKVEFPLDFRGEVQLSTTSGEWATGWRPLVGGAFNLDVTLGASTTEFRVEVRDLQGNLVQCEPQRFTVRLGLRSARPVAPYNFGVVGKKGTATHFLVNAGTPLPASGSGDFVLTKTIIAGSPDQGRIVFVEGLSSAPEENITVGECIIRGTDLKRTLKENEKIEIRVRMDESRLLTAKIYVPLLDQEYAVELHTFDDVPNAEELSAALNQTRIAIADIEDLVEEGERDRLIQIGRHLEQLEVLQERAQAGEVGEAERVHKELSDTMAALRPLRDRYELRAKHARAMGRIKSADALCERFNDAMGAAKLGDMRSDADKCLRLEDGKALDAVWERANDVFWEHYGKTPECWEYQVQWMREAAPMSSDPLTFYELVRRAEQALAQKDYEGVKLQAIRAWDYLPDPVRARNRYADSVIRLA
ncbi:MAG TPA: Hsp70 family protein [Fimbriimonadaceae bacterium]|nr:Hsp70 family protein [Fimbriimonadaceae bacterium]